MSKSRIGVFTPEDAARIHQAVLGRSSVQPDLNVQRKRTHGNQSFYVKLLGDLGQATNPETGYTMCSAVMLRYETYSDSLDMQLATSGTGTYSLEVIHVVNRYPNFSAKRNDLIFVMRSGAEWVPVVSGAGNTTTVEGNCGCFCIEDGDLDVGTYITTSEWSVSLNRISVTEINGVVYLPASDHILTWNNSAGYWQKNIGSFLAAETFNGTGITLSPTPSPAYIRFERNNDGYQKLTIQWPDNLTGTGT
jgi:hypothetical protein